MKERGGDRRGGMAISKRGDKIEGRKRNKEE